MFNSLIARLSSSTAVFAAESGLYDNATCTVNGQVVPCSEMSEYIKNIPAWFWGIQIVFLMIGIALFVFWLAMFIDVIKNENKDKTLWIIMLIFLSTLGAFIYYFAVKRQRAKLQPPTPSTNA